MQKPDRKMFLSDPIAFVKINEAWKKYDMEECEKPDYKGEMDFIGDYMEVAIWKDKNPNWRDLIAGNEVTPEMTSQNESLTSQNEVKNEVKNEVRITNDGTKMPKPKRSDYSDQKDYKHDYQQWFRAKEVK